MKQEILFEEKKSLRKKVLVIEDEENTLDAIKDIFLKMDCKVDIASDGEKGFQLINEDSYDLVVTDLKLPGKSGFEILEALKDINPGTKVIIITAYGEPNPTEDANKRGAFSCLRKPFRMKEMMAVAERALGIQS
ncbi:MAG: response regulator [bacterium]